MTVASCYLAYPIDQAVSGGLYDRVNEAKQLLIEAGVGMVYDPGDAFLVGSDVEPGPSVRAINNFAVDECEGMLAFLPKGQATIGVPIEVARAAGQGKPVALVSDVRSWALAGLQSVFRVGEGGEELAVKWLVGQTWNMDRRRALRFTVESGGTLPTRAYDDDAGFDLYVQVDTVIYAGQAVDVPLGVAVELPDWSYGRLVGRSSSLRKRGLRVIEGTIDAGYRGPLFALCENATQHAVYVKAGERIAQLLVQANMTRTLEAVQVPQLSVSKRGTNGFGSSGH